MLSGPTWQTASASRPQLKGRLLSEASSSYFPALSLTPWTYIKCILAPVTLPCAICPHTLSLSSEKTMSYLSLSLEPSKMTGRAC